MTTDAEYRALAERLGALSRGAWTHHDKDADGNEIMIDRTNDMHRLASAILALVEERDLARTHAVEARLRERAAEDARVSAVDRATLAESRLGKAVQALRQVSMACDLYGEDMSFGDMKTVHRIQEHARSVLSDLEKSE